MRECVVFVLVQGAPCLSPTHGWCGLEAACDPKLDKLLR